LLVGASVSALFVSPLARDLTAFITFKRALGQSYHREIFRLRSLDRFAAQHAAERGGSRLDRVIPRWLSRPIDRKPRCIHRELSVARQFCLFLRRRNPECFVPNHDLAPPERRSARFLPYIFSAQEIRLLLRQTKSIKGPPFRQATFRMLLLVLYCTGLRSGEAVRLTLHDVDLRGRTFFVSHSKGKSRWVPFHSGLARQLRNYLEERLLIAPASSNSRLFAQPNGRGYNANAISIVIVRLLRRIGLKPSKGRIGPRPYDLRHSFAVHRLTRWYRAGVDLHAHLPWLSAYMGHDNLLGTETYLTATPELLSVASRRFAVRFRRTEKL
jgi:integrase/recombinase XerD